MFESAHSHQYKEGILKFIVCFLVKDGYNILFGDVLDRTQAKNATKPMH